jgi:hypothetical protein
LKKLIENNQQSKGKSLRYQPTDFKNLKKKIREPKVSTLLPNVCDFQKEKPYSRVWILKSKENLWPSLWIFILCDYHLWDLEPEQGWYRSIIK